MFMPTPATFEKVLTDPIRQYMSKTETPPPFGFNLFITSLINV